jgi:hypothetical protein
VTVGVESFLGAIIFQLKNRQAFEYAHGSIVALEEDFQRGDVDLL